MPCHDMPWNRKCAINKFSINALRGVAGRGCMGSQVLSVPLSGLTYKLRRPPTRPQIKDHCSPGSSLARFPQHVYVYGTVALLNAISSFKAYINEHTTRMHYEIEAMTRRHDTCLHLLPYVKREKGSSLANEGPISGAGRDSRDTTRTTETPVSNCRDT